jgi:uncharacterized damage-inducible protein DinB
MTLREFYLKRCQAEFPVTRQVLRAIPKDRISYKPDERSPSAEQLVWTLTGELKGCLEAVTENRTEFKNDPPPPLADILQKFEQWSKELTDLVSKMDEGGWEKNVKLYFEGKLVGEQPVGSFLWLVLLDSIHHRGQLSAYLRPMGGKVPAIYGPSADDKGMGAWQ